MMPKRKCHTRNPRVIDPPNMDCDAAWKECGEYVEKCGGMQYPDGEVNWRAAFGADPGVCSCPNCHEYYWSWGRVVECLDCGFRFPTDSWAMYSWGVQAARPSPMKHRVEERLAHPYYRYGYEHPVDNPIHDHYEKLPWKELVPNFPEKYPLERRPC